MTTINPILTEIARHHLDIPTLETRKGDSLDFHTVTVMGVRDALKAAFDAGAARFNATSPAQAMAARSPSAEAVAVVPIVTVTVIAGLIQDVLATMPVHVVVEDWDVPDEDTGKKPARNVWKLDGELNGPAVEKLRRLIANN